VSVSFLIFIFAMIDNRYQFLQNYTIDPKNSSRLKISFLTP
jgi:hypothetical protein